MSELHPIQSLRILETCLYVDNLLAARDFYRDVLRLTLVTEQLDRHVFFRCGNQMLLLFDAAASHQPGDVPTHGCHGRGHLAFAASASELAEWEARLLEMGIDVEQRVEWKNGHSVYFRDPSGNSIEITSPDIWGIPD